MSVLECGVLRNIIVSCTLKKILRAKEMCTHKKMKMLRVKVIEVRNMIDNMI